ncbi:MAG: hypothetical protein KUA37_06810 [Desulfomicrobium sp.]|nr:hypothetical protein [Pseudomonadota bacterium]MBV1711702.1 hypothetical protein [Desulfomicrobium sp.]MBU4572710.1 hypothetical protein [Pseudomonadota bacterium]MBU4593509.1 hypothetical protein [Pseudomonadota bacterium]MBV1720431.1 hypothetical protein [Desulfomicrobium sp.]
MPVIKTKGVMCFEFVVRLDMDGSDPIEKIELLCEEVFQKHKEDIISKVLDDDKRPVGEFFDLTIAYDGGIKFFIPRSSLRRALEIFEE